jgi:D-alanyl-lipoteichoic acid acyltransferase DltB (MBOAT superfamily)
MARGLGKMMGFDIMLNFNLPFFVTNIQDYWNRWHISLSSWLRDYLYVPLVGGMRRLKGNARIYAALMISMTLIGLWHGASWTYVVFGVYYGLLLVAYVKIRLRKRRWIQPKSRFGLAAWTGARMVFMFHLIVIGMLLFRSTSVAQSGQMLWALATNFGNPLSAIGATKAIVFCVWLLVLVQIWQYRAKDLMCLYKSHAVVRAGFYVVAVYLLVMYGVTDGAEFIYFQF